MFWGFKGYTIVLCFGASRVIILVCVLELSRLYYCFVFWSFKGYNIVLCFGASRVILFACVLQLQGL